MYGWLLHKIHISWHIAGVSAGIIAGTALALILPDFFADFLWLCIAVVALGLVTAKRTRWLCIMACLAGGCIGAWRGVNEQLALQAYRPYYGQLLQVSGVLREDVSYGRHGDQRFELSEVRLAGSPQLQGQVWVSSTQKADLKRGDTVIVRGTLGEGFGTLPASMYRATIVEVTRPHPGDMARIFRDWFAAGVRQGVPEPQASLGIGYLTGQRSTLPVTLDEQLQTVGLTHAVVASGYNLTILVSFARNVLAGVSKYLATLAAGLMIMLFMLVTGFSPSMTRAGLVAGLSLAAWYYGRVVHPVVLLLLAAAVTIVLRPAYAWGDIGWCLSFTAFAGVIVLAPLLLRYLRADHEKLPIVLQLLIETVAAQVATLPIILHSFGQYAAYALPANLLVIPLVPLAMVCTFGAGVAGLMAPGLAYIAGWPATFILRYMTWVVERIANLPGASEEIAFNTLGLVLSYALLSLLTIWLWRKTSYDFRGGVQDIKKV